MIGQSLDHTETEIWNKVLLHKPGVLSVYSDIFFALNFYTYLWRFSMKNYCVACLYATFVISTPFHMAHLFFLRYFVQCMYAIRCVSSAIKYMFVRTYETINRFHRVSKIRRPVSYEFWLNYVPLWVLFRKWGMKGVCFQEWWRKCSIRCIHVT